MHWAIGEFSLAGVAIQPWQNMTGKQICAMGKESFLARAPAFMGDILWEHLEILQKGTSLFPLLSTENLRATFELSKRERERERDFIAKNVVPSQKQRRGGAP